MHTRTIAAALKAVLDEAANGPDDIPHIVGVEPRESGNIDGVSAIENDGSFHLDMEDGSRFRVDVIRVGGTEGR